jgi:hypothetical protein
MSSAWVIAALVVILVVGGAWGEGASVVNVGDFGAKGDGQADDTDALQQAMDAAAKAGGGIVFAPTGDYLIKGHLDVPDNVTLEGTRKAPARSRQGGTTLLAVEGAGNPDGTPFITLHTNSTLRGLAVFYPEQINENPPKAYPWCIRGIGDNCSIVDVLLVNPYQAVDFGTHPAGRHYIRGLYAQALYRGIFIDQCYDIGRVENAHIWPFWTTGAGKVDKFTLEKGEAFIIGRTDWEYMSNCLCIMYKVGFHFIGTKAGQPNVVLTQCGSDVGPLAVLVDACQAHAGISFVNGQFMAGIEVADTNQGPVKFTACGFWGVKETRSHAVLAGKGHVTFTGCHFNGWDRLKKADPCIYAKRGGLTVSGCDFMDEGKKQIHLGRDVDAAMIFGNRLRGGAKITNASKGDVQIGLNTAR